MKSKKIKKETSRYVKLVEWSDEDACFVGRCPELFAGGTHGSSEAEVYGELCGIVAETLADRHKRGDKLPKPLTAKAYSGKFILRTGAALHKALAVRAYKEGKSLNEVCVETLQQAH